MNQALTPIVGKVKDMVSTEPNSPDLVLITAGVKNKAASSKNVIKNIMQKKHKGTTNTLHARKAIVFGECSNTMIQTNMNNFASTEGDVTPKSKLSKGYYDLELVPSFSSLSECSPVHSFIN